MFLVVDVAPESVTTSSLLGTQREVMRERGVEVAHALASVAIGVVLGAYLATWWLSRARDADDAADDGDGDVQHACYYESAQATSLRGDADADVLGAIGNTPLTRVASLSALTGCDIYVKCEFLNPGGSVKDRVALRIVQDALSNGALVRGGVITEGTAGSTGVSLAMVAKAMGLKCFVAMPDDAALEKSVLVEAYGATVERVRPVSIAHRDHFVNVARRKANDAIAEHGKGYGYFADQFENLANYHAHYDTTGPEISADMRDKKKKTLDAFVCACGTGGTLAGVGARLKEENPACQIFLADPQGSGLFNRITRGVMYDNVEAEGRRLKNPFDTVTEGVGINRLTENFKVMLNTPGMISGAVKVSDVEAVAMSRFVARHDGLFIGSSSAVNLVSAVRVAQFLGPGHSVCTIACDSGLRHMTKFWSDEYLSAHNLSVRAAVNDVSSLAFLDKDVTVTPALR